VEFVSYDIEGNDFRRAGAASRAIKERLKRIGADADAIRRTMIAAYEAEMNVVIHADGGRLEASLTDTQIDVNVVDVGPGIPDVELAMTEGFSTAGAEARAFGFGAGMGLPNIRRSSDRVRVTSRVGEGTRVSFTVCLRPGATGTSPVISLYASTDRCRDCRSCLAACPTQAMRVRNGHPSVLEHLCVDCADCIAACAPGALTVREEVSSLDDLTEKADMVIAVPPAFLAGCGSAHPPSHVLAGLQTLGFAEVITVAPFERALREAAMGEARRRAAAAGATVAPPVPGHAPAVGAGTRGPVIVPSCPAVLNLIELRFPSLIPQLAPFESPWEALQSAYADRPVAYVVSCPGQRSALLGHDRTEARGACAPPRAEYLLPELVRQAVMARLSGPYGAPVAGEAQANLANPGAGQPEPAGHSRRPLLVTGMKHVIAALEQLENGLLDDVSVIDPYACEGACFGSPLLAEDHHVATRRWEQGRAAVEDGAARARFAERGAARAAAATARRRPFAARSGIRLDPDMSRAIEKLGRLQAETRALPGRDCGACGAPTCAALAEDVVMDRATVDLCPYAASMKEESEG
jgi:serine/threonine-protein kinase RsbT